MLFILSNPDERANGFDFVVVVETMKGEEREEKVRRMKGDRVCDRKSSRAESRRVDFKKCKRETSFLEFSCRGKRFERLERKSFFFFLFFFR